MIAGKPSIKAVTFDLWETLLLETNGTNSRRITARCKSLAHALNKFGIKISLKPLGIGPIPDRPIKPEDSFVVHVLSGLISIIIPFLSLIKYPRTTPLLLVLLVCAVSLSYYDIKIWRQLARVSQARQFKVCIFLQ